MLPTAGDSVTAVAAPTAALRPASTLGHLIRRAQQVHTTLWTARFDGELTGPQYAVLTALLQHGTIDQRTAGQRASLDKSTAADVVARLQRGGWLDRARDPGDGRRNLLTLTSPARSALRRLTPGAFDVQRRLLEPLSVDLRPWFVEHLRLVAYAGAPPPVHPATGRTGVLRLEVAPGHLIRRAEQLHGLHWVQLVTSELTPSQYGLLAAVAWQPSIDQRDAGDRASLDKSSVADITARLVNRGLLGRARDERDLRRRLLTLTDRGREVLEEVGDGVRAVQQRLTDPLSRDDADRLTRQLSDVAYR